VAQRYLRRRSSVGRTSG